MAKVLLNPEAQVIVVRRLVVYVETLRVGGRQKAGSLEKCVHVSVVSNRCKERWRIVDHVAPFAHAHVIEDRRTGAYCGLSVPEDIPGEAEPWSVENRLLIDEAAGKVLVARGNA